MELTQAIMSRRTVHNFAEASVADRLVEEALRLSLWAPNHKLTYPWHYTWIGPQGRSAMADLAVELKAAKGSISDVKRDAIRATVLNPAHIIALGLRRSASLETAHEDYATLACSVQIASLYLWQQGVASKWSTGGFTRHARTYEILGLDPQEIALEGALLIGQAAIMPPAPERPPLDRFLRRSP